MKETWEAFINRMKRFNPNYSPFMGSGNPRPETLKWMEENQPPEDIGPMKFEIAKSDLPELQEWMKKQRQTKEPQTAIGGRFTYSFTPTSVGVLVTVTDGVTGEELVLTGDM